MPSGVSPPLPLSSDNDAVGQNLLGLLRSFGKNPGDVKLLEETVEVLQELISVTHRRGLLQGDESVAEKVLALSGSQQGKQGGNKKQRGSKRGRSTDLTADSIILHTSETDSKATGPTLDGQLIMQGINRILSLEQLSDEKADPCGNMVLLIALAADFCTCVCESIFSRSSTDPCTIAEYELVALSGKQLLGNLESSARIVLYRIPEVEGGFRSPKLGQEESVYALKAILCACSTLIALFGTKLSRSSKILGNLRSLAWECLSVAADDVVQFAAKLVASLPFAGGTDNVTPSDLWNQTLRDALLCVHQTLYESAPIISALGQSEQQMSVSEHVKESMEHHIEMMQRSTSAQVRGNSLVHRLKALVSVVSSLLGCESDTFTFTRTANLLHAEVDVEYYLGLAEAMLSVPLAAETTFHSTKKRLRSEAIDGGLLSPSVLVQMVANNVKLCGCNLIHCILASLGGPTLLPYGRRILRISHATLLTSSSANVRKAVDPASEIQFSGKRQRWLHKSLKVRTVAVQTFRMALLAFGVDPSAEKSMARGSSRNLTEYAGNIERSINLVCGCILEEFSLQRNPQQESEEWGSPYERAELVAAAAECLSAALSSGGEYLPLSLRSLVDSVALICLSSIKDGAASGNALSASREVKEAVLDLACCSVETPWQDGGASSITGTLLEVARLFQDDAEPRVVQAARSAVRICESLDCSRVPALAIVSRSNELIPRPAEEMMKQLTIVQAEIDRHKAARQAEVEKAAIAISQQKGATTAPKEPKKQKKTGVSTEFDLFEESKSEIVAPKPSPPSLQLSKKFPAKAEMPSSPTCSRVDNQGGESLLDTRLSPEVDKKDGSDDELPMIVDCGPDKDDE